MPGMTKRARSTSRKGRPTTKRTRKLAPTRSIMSLKPTLRKVFPEARQHRTTLRYFGNFISVDPGAGGTAATHVFSANGLYDPDITGVGHQPIGFDQFMVMYDHYTVVGAKMVAYFQNIDTNYAQYGTITCRDSSVVSTDTREIIENGYVSICYLGPTGTAKVIGSCATSVDIAKFLGRSSALADNQLKGGAGSNPAEQVFFHVSGFPVGQADAASIRINVIIDYDVIFHERTVLGPS